MLLLLIFKRLEIAKVAALQAWYRPQKRLNPKNTKNTKKKNAKSLTPENTEKCTKLPFFSFFDAFFVLSGPNPGWGILHFFSDFFFCIFGIQGFLWSVPGPKGRKAKVILKDAAFFDTEYDRAKVPP